MPATMSSMRRRAGRFSGSDEYATQTSTISVVPMMAQAVRRAFAMSASSTAGASHVATVRRRPRTPKSQRLSVRIRKSPKKNDSSWDRMTSGGTGWWRTAMYIWTPWRALKPVPITRTHMTPRRAVRVRRSEPARR